MKNDKEGNVTVGKLVGVAVMVFVGVALLPSIVVFVSAAQNSTTGATDTIVGLITILYSLGIAIGAIMWVVHEAKS